MQSNKQIKVFCWARSHTLTAAAIEFIYRKTEHRMNGIVFLNANATNENTCNGTMNSPTISVRNDSSATRETVRQMCFLANLLAACRVLCICVRRRCMGART